jgi:hypothetical protein
VFFRLLVIVVTTYLMLAEAVKRQPYRRYAE